MISSLQPTRPRYPPPQSISPPMSQQPTRSYLSQPLSASSKSTRTYSPPAPRNQIEAMPPQMPRSSLQSPHMLLDPSKLHPVFFTHRLKKAPVGVDAGGGNWASPVATGYVFNDGARRAEGGVKL